MYHWEACSRINNERIITGKRRVLVAIQRLRMIDDIVDCYIRMKSKREKIDFEGGISYMYKLWLK